MKQPFVKGDLVQLFDLENDAVHEKTLGTVTGIHPKNGRLIVHWWAGVKLENAPEGFHFARIVHAKGVVS